jgi:glycosyltransferase involved in cell wall biosynthesis
MARSNRLRPLGPRHLAAVPSAAPEQTPRVDIVIPAHNEEHRLGSTLAAYREACPGPGYRFWVALDGCTDDTAAVAAGHAAEDARVRVVEYPKLGKGGVIIETFRRCDAELLAFVDADGATAPPELRRLVRAARRADGAIASRRHPASVVPAQRPLKRRVASAGFSLGVRALFHLPYSDTQCGAKVIHRRVVEQCLPFLSARDLLFDVDLLLTANRLGFRIVEVPTIWVDRPGSRVRSSDSQRMAASSVRLWLRHRALPVEEPAAALEGERLAA